MKLLLTTLLALAATAAQAQYLVDSLLPRPTATEATNVTENGYTANWKQFTLDDYLETNAIGFYVRTYAKHTAQADGEPFFLINTNFDYLAPKGGTIDNPTPTATAGNMFVRGTIGEPNRPGTWTTVNTAYAGDVLCLDGKYNMQYANGQMVLSITDLSNGGGDVHFKFRARSDAQGRNMVVQLRKANTSDADDVIDKYEISNLGTEWRDVEFTLHGGQKESDIIIMGTDMGNLYKMFYFIDDLQIWQELKKGETAQVLYNDSFLMDDIEGTSLDMAVGGTYEGDSYAYTVSSYSTSYISLESDLVDVPPVASGIGSVNAAGEAVSPDTPVTVYSLSGTIVVRGTAGNMPTTPRGVYLVKTGDKVVKARR